MATNPFKQAPAAIPSTTQTSNAQHHYDEPPAAAEPTVFSSYTSPAGSGGGTPDSNSILKQRATCACSNISIMQLFHEMKQKYPTVPDTVVSELVTQNCHDRPACIGKLEEAVLGTPAQTTYPAQSIHSGSLKRRSGDRKFGGNRSDGSNSSSNSSRESSVDSSRLQGPAAAAVAATGPSDSRLTGECRTAARPTTLAVRPTTVAAAAAAATPGVGCFGALAPPAVPMRPNRTAPPCPPGNGPLATSTITTTTTASSSAELGGETAVNLQVNVTVSPKTASAGVGPLVGGQRHTSTISLQPEPPYTRELAQVSSTFSGGGAPGGGSPAAGGGPTRAGGTGAAGNGRSSTSVNLTLRQPTDGRPHTPIHFHASPLRYTARNFNAQSGIQSKLEVTFRDGFGSFSAVRAQVPSYETRREHASPPSPPPPPPLHHRLEREPAGVSLPEGHSGWYQSPSATGASSRVQPYMMSGFPPPLSSSSPLPHHSMVAHAMIQPPAQRTTGMGGRQAMYGAAGTGHLENDGLTKEMRYQNFVVAEMAVSQQLEQKQRLSLEVERKRTQFESICREIFVLQQSLAYIDAELLDREVLLLAAEVEQLQKKVDTCDDEEAWMQAQAAAAGASITDGLSALSVEGGSPLMLPASSTVGGPAFLMNRPPKPPRPPPPARPSTQSPSRGSSGSITPGTPLLAASTGASPLPTPSSSSSSPCSTSSSSFTTNGGADPLAASRLQLDSTWTCSLCTFHNHELMPACEVCSLPKASGSSSSGCSGSNRAATAAPSAGSGDVCDGGAVGPRAAGALLRRQHHLSVDTGVAAAVAAAAAAVVGASVAGPSTAPPYPGLTEMPPPSFASLAATGQVQQGAPQQTLAVQQPPPPQQAQSQAQQANPPPLQNAQYQKSSIEC
uniref:RanBP2-type domain-containing protein n=1 Tax=Anopheles dirus TaxID=7168 RepID=A0A182N3I7_9DIPT